MLNLHGTELRTHVAEIAGTIGECGLSNQFLWSLVAQTSLLPPKSHAGSSPRPRWPRFQASRSELDRASGSDEALLASQPGNFLPELPWRACHGPGLASDAEVMQTSRGHATCCSSWLAHSPNLRRTDSCRHGVGCGPSCGGWRRKQ